PATYKFRPPTKNSVCCWALLSRPTLPRDQTAQWQCLRSSTRLPYQTRPPMSFRYSLFSTPRPMLFPHTRCLDCSRPRQNRQSARPSQPAQSLETPDSSACRWRLTVPPLHLASPSPIPHKISLRSERSSMQTKLDAFSSP